MAVKPRPTLTILAGVNGAGKSSVGGQALRESGAEYFNPDEQARLLRGKQPNLTQEKANAISWAYGKAKLEEAIATRQASVRGLDRRGAQTLERLRRARDARPSSTRDTGGLRVHLANLRRKLEPDPARPRYLITEPGIGYRFVP